MTVISSVPQQFPSVIHYEDYELVISCFHINTRTNSIGQSKWYLVLKQFIKHIMDCISYVIGIEKLTL
jgi:hypothetical protein